MTNQHPITPPPELVVEWAHMLEQHTDSEVFTQAARWGADQELEACCALMDDWGLDPADLRAARRPQPQPSLREQALSQLECIQSDLTRYGMGISTATIRAALEQLPDDPAVTPAADARGPGSVTEQASPVATDEDIRETLQRAPGTIAERCRAIYNLGREHGAQDARSRDGDPALTADGLVVQGWDVKRIADRLAQLSKAVTEGRDAVSREFTMRVPAEPYRDADLVLSTAADLLRDLGDKHGAPLSPAPTADGGEPLWELMHKTCKSVYLHRKGSCLNDAYAEIMRLVADWLERKWSNKSMLSYGAAVDMLRAEADRAEAGQ